MTVIELRAMESIISNLPRIAKSIEVIAASKDESAENVLELDDKDLEYLYLSVCNFLDRAGALKPDIMYGDLRRYFVEYYKTPKNF